MKRLWGGFAGWILWMIGVRIECDGLLAALDDLRRDLGPRPPSSRADAPGSILGDARHVHGVDCCASRPGGP